MTDAALSDPDWYRHDNRLQWKCQVVNVCGWNRIVQSRDT